MKKFYKQVDIHAADDGFHILLDGKPVKTPAKATLTVPSEVMARQIVQEWATQPDDIDPKSMYHMNIAVTAQDYVAKNRSDIEGLILRYADTDLLCYQVDEPAALKARQEALWNAALSWFSKETAVTLSVKKDIGTQALSELDRARLQKIISDMDVYTFTVFQLAVSVTGSFVLAYALLKQALSVDEIFKATKLEELFFIEVHDLEKHGPDPIQSKEFDGVKRELEACAAFIKNL